MHRSLYITQKCIYFYMFYQNQFWTCIFKVDIVLFIGNLFYLQLEGNPLWQKIRVVTVDIIQCNWINALYKIDTKRRFQAAFCLVERHHLKPILYSASYSFYSMNCYSRNNNGICNHTTRMGNNWIQVSHCTRYTWPGIVWTTTMAVGVSGWLYSLMYSVPVVAVCQLSIIFHAVLLMFKVGFIGYQHFFSKAFKRYIWQSLVTPFRKAWN